MNTFREGLNLLTYDFEVVKNDWLVVFKRYGKDEYMVCHNDSQAVIEFLQEEKPVLVGFNNKHYDKWILRAVTQGRDPSEIKEVNDWIIGGHDGWQHPFFKSRNGLFVPQFDIRDDMQDGISLKSIEAQMGWDIRESGVQFDIDRPLNNDELTEMIEYCKADVAATEKIVELRSAYLDAKVDLGEMAGMLKAEALNCTNATLTAKYLDAEAQTFDDERQYIFPDTLLWRYIPECVKQFFNAGYDPNIPDDEVFTGMQEFMIDDCPVTIGWGGIHAAIPTYSETETEERCIRNWDVASLYPSLMIQYGYTSRCMANPQDFVDVYNTRIKAKKSGDKKTSNTLKLVLNTTYGTMLLPGGQMYDPRMGHSVCVSGQLLILELAMHLHEDFKSLKIIQLNTDGIMVSCLRRDLDAIHRIVDEWQKRTRLVLEEDEIRSVCAQKDVNNYVIELSDGHFKTKGAYFKRGVSLVGAFSVNNDFNVVKTALFEAIAHGIPVRETIEKCDDYREFALVARGGSKYSKVTHLVDGQEYEVQKCNRVYASRESRDGLLYKYHRETGKPAKIANCPEHCFIENSAEPVDIGWIDKEWYIKLAEKRLSDFYPKKPKKKKEEQTQMEIVNVEELVKPEEPVQEVVEQPVEKAVEKTVVPVPHISKVYLKLARARCMLLDAGIKPTGKNLHMKFKYFELSDFVPQITRIFDKVGLISIFKIDNNVAYLFIVDAENPEDMENFFLPFHTVAANQAVPEVQALGAGITYYRRYLYMMAMDICENDSIDAETVEESVMKPTAPATVSTAAPVNREEAKAQLTQSVVKPSEEDVAELKAALIALREKVPGSDTFVQQIALETKSFTSFTHEAKEKYMIEIGNKIEKEGK